MFKPLTRTLWALLRKLADLMSGPIISVRATWPDDEDIILTYLQYTGKNRLIVSERGAVIYDGPLAGAPRRIVLLFEAVRDEREAFYDQVQALYTANGRKPPPRPCRLGDFNP